MSILEAKSVSASHAGVSVFTDLDFRLEAGQVWGILGPNGVGKTTLLHLLAGLDTADDGQITLDSQLLFSLDRKLRARTIGLLFQDSQDTFPATVLETVMMGRFPHSAAWGWESRQDVDVAMTALDQVGLAAMAQRHIPTLSGGERRRVAIAMLMAQDPQIWLLDEPTNHLDLHQQMQVLERLVDQIKQKNRSAAMVLQDVNLVARYCTHALLMVDANNRIQGVVEEVLNRENLQRLYRHRIEVLQLPDGPRFFYPA